ncbi:MAG TPA: cytochrome C [Nitrospirota bacterium]|nr:cytochrome C [Nitrospirota bacterium]
MKRCALIVFIALATAVGISFVFAAEGASIEKGKALFNDPKLGTTGKSCNSCHPDGQNIQKAGFNSDLDRIVNGCITHSIKGKALAPQSIEMQSLILYIKSLGAKQPAAKAKPAVGC